MTLPTDPTAWPVDRRPAGAPGARWVRLTADAGGPDAARAEAHAPPPEVRPLDLLRLGDGPAREHWFVGEDRVARRLPRAEAPIFCARLGDEDRRAIESYGDDWAGLWEDADRGDLLLDLAVAAGVDRAPLVLVACAIARRAWPALPPDDGRPEAAVEAAERRARGGLADADVAAAAAAAHAAAQEAGRVVVGPAARACQACRDAARGWLAPRHLGDAAWAVAQVAARVDLRPGAPPHRDVRFFATGAEAEAGRRAADRARADEAAAQADLVRAAIPLPAVLLALLSARGTLTQIAASRGR